MKKIILLLIVLFLVSCSNNDKEDINNLINRKQPKFKKSSSSSITEKERLYSSYKKWEGTPYLWGGETRLGIDCSAFMQRVFEEVYDFEIPRTTTEQMLEGRNPGYMNRQLGDLIFFKTGPDTFHVGVYYQNDNFFHSSSTFGVTMSNLNEEFWKKTYLKIRRFKE